MKELYVAPELNLICFAPATKIANSDDLLGDTSNVVSGTIVDDGDIDLDL